MNLYEEFACQTYYFNGSLLDFRQIKAENKQQKKTS